MDLVTIMLLAIGVSADAFAVAVGHGASARCLTRAEAVRVAFAFGLFQALMPAFGWFLGHRFQSMIMAYDHWLAFVLLGSIGGKMIWDDQMKELPEAGTEAGISNWHHLTLAVATSIDALAVGVGLSFLPSIFQVAVSIGIVTFSFSLMGVIAGHKFKNLAQKRAKTIGGLILIFIGCRILLEHLRII